MAKKELTVSEFREIIREEAMKLKKRMVLENEKRTLENELKSLNESYMDENMDDLEEGIFGPDKSEIEANRQSLEKKIDELLAEIPEEIKVLGTKSGILKRAAEYKFKGKPWLKKGSSGELILSFEPELSGIQKFAQAAGSSLRGGHTFGSGRKEE